MSGDGFHVHGPHDHELEHAAQGGDKFSGRVAVMTAVLATAGALFSYEGGLTMANAGLAKNDAAIKKTEAANQWSYYQAKGGKRNLAELGAKLTVGAQSEGMKKEAERYKVEQEGIKKDAEKLEAQASAFEKVSERELHHHHRWALAMTLIQVAISLAAIALLTRAKWLTWGAGLLGLAALGMGALAFLGV